jgi:hypothetical protein
MNKTIDISRDSFKEIVREQYLANLSEKIHGDESFITELVARLTAIVSNEANYSIDEDDGPTGTNAGRFHGKIERITINIAALDPFFEENNKYLADHKLIIKAAELED